MHAESKGIKAEAERRRIGWHLMKARVLRHYERNVIFYQSIRTAALMIAALIVTLSWELANK